jgi:uncharacterized protein (DUF2252 family)
VTASDLARTSSTMIWPQICGDAHLSNFGLFGTPERALVFDLNDFDEKLPGQLVAAQRDGLVATTVGAPAT